MRVEFGFTPKWYRETLDIDFSERWHEDPRYRAGTVLAMRRELNRRFPELGLGGAETPENAWTLDGVYGALPVAMMLGAEAEYYSDNWPAARIHPLDAEAAGRLEPPDLDNCPIMDGLMRQMDVIEAECGVVRGYVNWQGVLNTAYRLRGQDVLMDLAVDAPLARHLFDVVTETIIEAARMVYARQRETGVDNRHLVVSNCLVNMVSTEQYEEFLLPCDKRISEAFELFGVHNCAWNIDPYRDAYARLRPAGVPLGYIDMGMNSDLAAAKRCFPATRRAVMYTPTDLASKALPAIEEDLKRVRDGLAPCDIVAADIEAGTPDERVRQFAEIARRLA